jgi:hypothetical protein
MLMANETDLLISTRPKAFVFVLMPFKSDYDDLDELGIKAACAEAGAHCERVDEQQEQGIFRRLMDRLRAIAREGQRFRPVLAMALRE